MTVSRLLVSLGALCASISFLQAQPDRITGRAFATRSPVLGQHGMACTSQPLATQVALEVLKSGGSAVDAAIAANAALGLMEPTGSGIGGDLFAIVWDAKTQKLYGLNGSGRSPLGLDYAGMQAELAKIGRTTIPNRGLLPISVPGCVDAWFELHAKFGLLPMKDLLEPAARYAEQGFPVTQYIALLWDNEVHEAQHAKLPGAFLDVFAPGGRAPREGEIFRNPDLARTLRLLGAQGRDAFYRGEVADKIDAFMRAHGGFLRKLDFEKHTSTWVEPVSVNYRGYDVYELPPNTQGIAALQMLNILEGYDLKSLGRNSPEVLHLMVEAKKLAFEDRAKFYADPAFAKVPLSGLLSKEYAAARRKLIGTEAAKTYDAGTPALSQGDTIYLCTADRDGNMVSLIQSNYFHMGSFITVPGLGFDLHDRGVMFVTTDPQHANAYAPGKRPFHTIIPGFVMKDGQPWEAFGVMGGSVQPQAHVQVLVNQIDFGLGIQEAGDAARWRHEGSTDYGAPKMRDGGYVQLESGIPYETRRALTQRGHDLRAGADDGGFGGYQAIRWDPVNKVYWGASESRKDGQAAGY